EVRKQTKFAPLIHPDDLKERQLSRDAQIARLKDEIAKVEESAEDAEESLKSLREELARWEKNDPLAGVAMVYAIGELSTSDARVQKNGNPRTASEVAPRGVRKIFGCQDFMIPAGASGRLELARWMTQEASHLTARVMANRLWQYHFGKP